MAAYDVDRALLRQRRIALGMTQRMMADLLGVSPSMWSRMECGSRRLQKQDILRAASVLGLRVKDLRLRRPR
jgi:transcriptional regulator with XRE-family HTH domain